MKTRNLFFTFLFVAAAIANVFAQDASVSQNGETRTVTVEQAVALAMEGNLGLNRSAITLAASRRTANTAWNSLLPSVNASASTSHPTSPTGTIEPSRVYTPGGLVEADRDFWTPAVSLGATLSFSTSIIENMRAAAIDYESGRLSYEAARASLELQVRKLFYQVLLADANSEFAAANFASAESRYQETATRAQVGQVPRLDELSARVDMENFRQTMAEAQMQYNNILDTFKTVLGLPARTQLVLSGDLETPVSANIRAAVKNSGEPLEVSILSTSIRSLKAKRNAAIHNAYIPSLTFQWNNMLSYNIKSESWSDGTFSIGLGINIANFLPWSNANNGIAALNDSIRSAEIELSQTMRNRDDTLNQNFRTVETILESMEATRLNVELAQSSYEMTQEAFRRGGADYQRLRLASDSLAQARNRLLQVQYNLAAAVLDIENELNIPFGTLSKGEVQ